MSEEKTIASRKNKARRNLLKGIVAGGGALTAGKALPENWAKPVVEAVTLPAHAQTTSENIQALSPFESGAQDFGQNDLGDTGERFAALDAPVESADWDKLSDAEILDFFARPAYAGTEAPINASSSYQMFADVNGNTGRLCMFGFVEGGGPFDAILSNTPVQGNTIKGGIATSFGVDEVEFHDFTLNGTQLTGSFDLRLNNATSTTDVSVVLNPSNTGCDPT